MVPHMCLGISARSAQELIQGGKIGYRGIVDPFFKNFFIRPEDQSNKPNVKHLSRSKWEEVLLFFVQFRSLVFTEADWCHMRFVHQKICASNYYLMWHQSTSVSLWPVFVLYWIFPLIFFQVIQFVWDTFLEKKNSARLLMLLLCPIQGPWASSSLYLQVCNKLNIPFPLIEIVFNVF